MQRARAVTVAVTFLATAALAAQTVPDLRVVPGQPAQGEIAFDGEEDRVAVDLLAGAKLTFTAKASRKSALRPDVALYDAAGVQQTVDPAQRVVNKASASVKRWVVPATGTYLLGVRGTAPGPTGLYDLTTRTAPAPKAAPWQGSIDAADEVDEYAFDAAAGTTAKITLKAAKGAVLVPRVVAVLGPGGAEVALEGAVRRSKGTSDSLKGLVLPAFGRYAVRVSGDAGTTGGYTLSVALKAPAAPRGKLDFRGASGGEAGAGEVTSLEIVPGALALDVGATRQLAARATWADGRVRDATRVANWATRAPYVATVENGARGGLLTVHEAGATTVRAWAGAAESRDVLLLAGGVRIFTVSVIPSAPVVAAGDTIELRAAAFVNDVDVVPGIDVTNAADWASPAGVPVTFAGPRVTAGGTPGAAQVTASLAGVTSAPRTLTVTAPRVERIVVAPAYAEIAAGQRAFAAAATFSDGTTADVTESVAWASDNEGAATMSGPVATFAGQGTSGIRATLDGVTSRAAVLNCGPVALQSIAVTGAATVGRGATHGLAANGTFADGGTRDLAEAAAWSSDAPATVSVSTDPGTRGRVRGETASGPATITASLATGAGTRTGRLAVAAAPAERGALVVVPRSGSVAVGATVRFGAFHRMSDGSHEDVSALATWTTSNQAAVTVAGGTLTGVADGGAVISASLDGRTAGAIALCGAARVTGISVQAPAATPVGDAEQATAAVSFDPNPGAGPPAEAGTAVSWFGSDPLALPVDATGVVSARRVAAGTLAAAVEGLASADAAVASSAPVARALRIFPQVPRTLVGTDAQLAAQSSRSDGSVADVAGACTWSSSDESAATIGATGLVHGAAKGTTTIGALDGASGLTDGVTFYVVSDAPTITSVSPPTLYPGTSANVVTIGGTNLDGFGPSVTFSGTGVTADSAPVTNADGTQVTVPVTVAAGAALGPRDLTYATLAGSATKTGAVSVISSAPAIASVSPGNIDIPLAGSSAVLLTVTGANFGAGTTFSISSSPGVSLAGVSVVNGTTMTGTVTVQSTALKARLDVTVTQSAQAGGQTATLPGGLKIGPPDPAISSVTPAYFLPGVQGAAGTIAGTNFGAGITLSFTGSAGNFTATYSRTSSASIAFTISAAPNAAPGLYDVVLQNSGDIPRVFAGRLVLAPRDATVDSFSAASLSRGASAIAVEVLGSDFLAGDSLSASGGGVTFSSVTVVSAERITANVSVAANAAISLRDLGVVHADVLGGRAGTLRGAFRVTGAVPSVTSCNPSRAGRTGSGGPTRRVPVTVTGANFCAGATVTITRTSSGGLTVVGTPAVLSDTQLAVDVDLAGTATVGSWDVTVTNPGALGNSGTSGNAKFDVVSESTLAVNRVVAPTGRAGGGARVTVYGSGFVRGCVVDFGTQRAPGVQFIDQNTLVCTVPAPADPASSSTSTVSRTATTRVDVRVTVNPGQGNSANATLTGGYGYLADATNFMIVQSYPADGSTGVAQNLRSAVMRLNAPVNTHTPHAGTSLASPNNPTPTDCGWFEAGGSFVSGQTVAVAADRRFLVFSRTSTGNLAAVGTPTPGQYVTQTSTSVKSASGAPLVPAKLAQALTFDQWGFTISTSVTDNAAPNLSNTVPPANAVGVPTSTGIVVTFSEPIDPLTVTTSAITLTTGGTTVACDLALSDDIRTVTLTPYTELTYVTTYTVTIGGSIADLAGNTYTQSTFTFTTATGADTSPPAIDSVVIEEIPASMDGSGTYVAGTDTPASTTNGSQAYDLYLPKSGWRVTVAYSDAGGSGIDEAQFSAKASVASGSSGANAELASKFDVTSTRAVWTVASADALAAADDVTLTFLVKDKTGNTSQSRVVTIDTVDIGATAAGAAGGDLGPFGTRETWVLRFDRDVYTASLSANGSTQQCTTTASSNGIADVEESLRICGLATANMTTDAANTVNGPSLGTNAIVVRLVEERVRATLGARFGIGEDGSRGADAANVEFLLPGEQGSLALPPTWSSASTSNSAKAYSEMDIGGDTGPNNNATGSYTTIGYAYFDTRNLSREANINGGASAGNNNGIFAIDIAKGLMNASTTGTNWGARVLAKFQTAKGGTPVGEGSLDDDVLSGSYDRTSGSAANTQAMKDRYDAIMDAIEQTALSISGVTAHEIGHSVGLVPDGGPKTGFFGNAPHANAFTEATAAFPNTASHLNALGNDVMSPASSVDQRTATGTDFMVFSPYDRGYLLHRQVHDEGR